MTFADLPSVDELLKEFAAEYPRPLAVTEIRAVLDQARAAIREAKDVGDIRAAVQRRLQRWEQPALRHVINATGVVLHTNLGRAPSPGMSVPAGYCNLEYDLATGKRGKRDAHFVHNRSSA